MNGVLKTEFRERAVAGFLLLAGIFSFIHSLTISTLAEIQWEFYLLGGLLIFTIVQAEQHPIHILRGTKISLINLPIFLAAALLPAPCAILTAGIGLSIAGLLTRIERGLFPRDIAMTVGQWMFVTYLGHQITHLNVSRFSYHASRYGVLFLCAATFLLVDFLIFSLSHSFIFGEPFSTTLKTTFKEGFILELVQYLLAILGVLAARENHWALLLLTAPTAITYMAFKNFKEMRHETAQVLVDMADTVDLRDIYTGGHSKRVAELVRQILIQLKISGPEANIIEIAARLHDIGKIGIPDSILMKPGKLSASEMALMQTHPRKGEELIAKYKDFARGATMILHHHERWDGKGYPAGLKEHEIPFGARVIAVADSFDAMTSDRPYRKALTAHQAIQILLDGRSQQWETSIVNAFVEVIQNQLGEPSEKNTSTPQTALEVAPYYQVPG